MEAPQLGIDSEDLYLDMLPAIERSFDIKFTNSDFHKDFTYGELHSLVLSRLGQTPSNDCTTQQAFYKLRLTLRPFTGAVEIRPDSNLPGLLPADPRPAAAAVEAALQMKLKLVGMPNWAAITGTLSIVLSLVLFFFSWQLALALLGLSIMGLDLASQLGRTLRFGTVRQVVEHMSTYHYQQSRRRPGTVNPREVAARLERLFIDMQGLEAGQLVPEAIL